MSMPIRVGQGFDVHVLCEGRPLIFGRRHYSAYAWPDGAFGC